MLNSNAIVRLVAKLQSIGLSAMPTQQQAQPPTNTDTQGSRPTHTHREWAHTHTQCISRP